ncbi:MAG: sporulation initiation factor Spo0A [Oscillospiraceae bacterium]|nr:sporulation initiation factor Spo0A [Oscillospiraceae bacterium]
MKKSRLDEIIEAIAHRDQMTAAQVRKNIQEAMDAGLNNPDPMVQSAWNAIPKKGEKVTMEEFILYLSSQK